MIPSEMYSVDQAEKFYLRLQEFEKVYPMFTDDQEHYAMRAGKFESKTIHENKTYYQWFDILCRNVNNEEGCIMQQQLEIKCKGWI